MSEFNEIKVLKEDEALAVEWGSLAGQLYYQKGGSPELDIAPSFFYVSENYIMVKDWEHGNVVFKFYDRSGRLIFIEDFKTLFSGIKKFINYDILKFFVLNGRLFVLMLVETKKETTLYLVRDYDRKLIVINDNFSVNHDLKELNLVVSENYSIILHGKRFVSYYDTNGKLIGDYYLNDDIMYVDKYKNIYQKISEREIRILSIESGHEVVKAAIDIPPEIGPEFKIDGGDVDTYLFQWNKTCVNEKINEDDDNIIQFFEKPGLLLYKLEMTEDENWYLFFKGMVIPGENHFYNIHEDYKESFAVSNYIEKSGSMVVINKHSVLYFAQRNDKEFQIIEKSLNL